MRAILSKVVAVSMIASAGLLVTACGGSEANNTTTVTTNEVDTTNVAVSEDMTGSMDAANGTEANTTATTTTSNTTTTATTGNTM